MFHDVLAYYDKPVNQEIISPLSLGTSPQIYLFKQQIAQLGFWHRHT